LGIVRSLGRQGVPVCVVDDERSIASASRWATHRIHVPDLHEPAAVLDSLRRVRQRVGQDGWVLFPTRDETVAVLAQARDELLGAFRVPTPSWECIEIAWDKRRTYEKAAELGVPAPRTWLPRTTSDLDDIDCTGPLLLKPAIKEHFFYATGAKGWRVDGRPALEEAFERATAVVGAEGEILVQEMIPGGGDAQLSYCALVRDGRPLAVMTVRRLRQHPSDIGRSSTYVETADLPELEEPSTRFLSAIRYSGLVELEYKRDPRDGVPKLLDVNARTWGYHGVGAAAGVDFPHLLYLDQLGRFGNDGPPLRARSGVRWVRLATDLPNAVRDLRAGRLDARAYLRTLRGVDVSAVADRHDPLPGLYELALLPYLAVRRGL
jgi:predicted ATP-grasp superfamily ATP-dependent carboligase